MLFRSVAISGGTVVVSGAVPRSGSVYAFEKKDGTWLQTQTKKLVAPDAAEDDYFGHSVAISGGTIVVGAEPSLPDHVSFLPRDDDDRPPDSNSGSAYVYGVKTTPAIISGQTAEAEGTMGSTVYETTVVGGQKPYNFSVEPKDKFKIDSTGEIGRAHV